MIIDQAIMIQSSSIELEGKVKVSSKGQIVVPIEVRKAAGIKEGGGQELRYIFKDGKFILEVENYLSPDELLGFFDEKGDHGDFVLDLHEARENRAEEILNKDL